jgi:hypothetical protein
VKCIRSEDRPTVEERPKSVSKEKPK